MFEICILTFFQSDWNSVQAECRTKSFSRNRQCSVYWATWNDNKRTQITQTTILITKSGSKNMEVLFILGLDVCILLVSKIPIVSSNSDMLHMLTCNLDKFLYNLMTIRINFKIVYINNLRKLMKHIFLISTNKIKQKHIFQHNM